MQRGGGLGTRHSNALGMVWPCVTGVWLSWFMLLVTRF